MRLKAVRNAFKVLDKLVVKTEENKKTKKLQLYGNAEGRYISSLPRQTTYYC
jgi:hypothetical protein